MIAILATIGGATEWEDIELYAEGHAQWLGTFLALPHGIPHADCYRRVFARIEADALQWAGLQSVVMVYRQRYLWNGRSRRNPVFLEFPAL